MGEGPDTPMCADVAITLGTYPDRCGYGPRLPLLVSSPWTRVNYVSHTLTDQSSIVRFIEDNWLGRERRGCDLQVVAAAGAGGLEYASE